MEMVAAAKMRKAQERMRMARPFPRAGTEGAGRTGREMTETTVQLLATLVRNNFV